MMSAEQNHLLTQVGAGTPGGNLLRRYWQPIALVDEFDATVAPEMALRPVKPVRLLGQDFVLFRDESGRFGLLDRDCPHRGADLSYGRREPEGLRCPFHGWMFDVNGKCLETPAEPAGSKLCERVTQRAYPVIEKNGLLFAYLRAQSGAHLGDQTNPTALPAFAALDCFNAPLSHVFVFKGFLECNWLQALEVGIDPAHASFLHRYFDDEDVANSYGKQFRGQSTNSNIPMTQLLREFPSPELQVEATEFGMRLIALRKISPEQTHVRVTNQIFPQAFVIPLSAEISITQWHVPIDDTHCYWYAMFTSFTTPIDKQQMREQRLKLYTLPDYKPRVGKHNRYGFNVHEQLTQTYTGMGSDINVHDQWAVESPGPIQDRTREHLGTSDKAIMMYRKQLLNAMKNVDSAPAMVLDQEKAKAITGPATIDVIAPSHNWSTFWREADAAKRLACSWAPTL
jgi:phthalate 4,5-dioxygenase